MSDLTGPADLRDAQRLAALEVVIERGVGAFIEVGAALIEVRESRLYRLQYDTFEAYCRGRWGFKDARARQLMSSVEVVRALSADTTGNGVVSERQARELVPVLRAHGPKAASAVMAEAVARANGQPSARVIREVVAEIIEPTEEESALDLDVVTPSAVANSTAVWLADLKRYVAGITNVPPPPQADPAVYKRLRRRLVAALCETIDNLARDE